MACTPKTGVFVANQTHFWVVCCGCIFNEDGVMQSTQGRRALQKITAVLHNVLMAVSPVPSRWVKLHGVADEDADVRTCPLSENISLIRDNLKLV